MDSIVAELAGVAVINSSGREEPHDMLRCCRPPVCELGADTGVADTER